MKKVEKLTNSTVTQCSSNWCATAENVAGSIFGWIDQNFD
jgi:hypothetical protein